MRTKEQDRHRKAAARAANPEKARQREAAYRAKSPLTMLLQRARTRAARDGIPFDLSPTDVTFPAACPILGIPLQVSQGKGKRPADHSPSLDRIRPELGYVKGNVAVISMRANRIKNDATTAEVRQLLTWMEKQ